jgi:hypothetical protein
MAAFPLRARAEIIEHRGDELLSAEVCPAMDPAKRLSRYRAFSGGFAPTRRRPCKEVSFQFVMSKAQSLRLGLHICQQPAPRDADPDRSSSRSWVQFDCLNAPPS